MFKCESCSSKIIAMHSVKVCCESLLRNILWRDVAKVCQRMLWKFCDKMLRKFVKECCERLWWNICRSIYHNALWYMMQLTISFLKNNSLNVWWRFMMKLCDKMLRNLLKCLLRNILWQDVAKVCDKDVVKVCWRVYDVELYHSLLK